MKYAVKEKMSGLWFVDIKVDGEEEYTGAYIVASGKEGLNLHLLKLDFGP